MNITNHKEWWESGVRRKLKPEEKKRILTVSLSQNDDSKIIQLCKKLGLVGRSETIRYCVEKTHKEEFGLLKPE